MQSNTATTLTSQQQQREQVLERETAKQKKGLNGYKFRDVALLFGIASYKIQQGDSIFSKVAVNQFHLASVMFI